MLDEPPREPPSNLTRAEQEARALAARLLERLAYDPADVEHELVRDTRQVARGVLALAAALEAERSVRITIQERCERQQALLGKRAYDALEPEP